MIVGKEMWLSHEGGGTGFCQADFNLKQQRQKWNLLLLRVLTAVYCILQTLPRESVAKFVLSNVHTWFILCNRQVKRCLSSFIFIAWKFESNGSRVPPHQPKEATVLLSFEWVVLLSFLISVKHHNKERCYDQNQNS